MSPATAQGTTVRLPDTIIEELRKHKVEVFEASRITTSFWNERRGPKDPRFYGGWYWYTKSNTQTINGPFKTLSAAYRDAFVRVVLRSNAIIEEETVISAPKRKGGR